MSTLYWQNLHKKDIDNSNDLCMCDNMAPSVLVSKYSKKLKEKVIRLHLQEGRSQASLEREYNIGRGTVSNWIKSYNKECQTDISKKEKRKNLQII